MKSKSIFNAMLFFSISFFSFSLIALLISFIVKDEQIFIAAAKPKSNHSDKDLVKEEMLNFGGSKRDITANNIFDPLMRNIDLASVQYGAKSEKPVEVKKEDINFYLENPENCMEASNIKLIGTVMAIPETDSSAMISTGGGSARGKEGGGGPAAIVVSIGEEIDAGTSVAGIRRNLVVFKTVSGLRCVGEDVGKNVGKEAAGLPGAPNNPENEDMNVKRVGQNSYSISREELTKATTNLNTLAMEARIVPDRQENGFKVFSIRPGSLYTKIGIENGDVIKSINGIELSSPDKALEAYQRLRNTDKISLDIVRRGKKETLEYNVE